VPGIVTLAIKAFTCSYRAYQRLHEAAGENQERLQRIYYKLPEQLEQDRKKVIAFLGFFACQQDQTRCQIHKPLHYVCN
jgi:hypothetical protein